MKPESEVRYSQLVDVQRLQALFERFHAVIGIANAVIDVDGEVIAHAGWQDACTDFHRVNPETCRRCIASDTSLVASMTRGEQYAVYDCLNGLVDTAAPIVVEGRHVANVFTGQFLTRPADLGFFRRQAQQAGFDEASYLAAIARVPVVPLERVETVTRLYAQLAAMLADSGMDKLRQQRMTQTLTRLNEELEARVAARTAALSRSEARLRTIIETEPECVKVVSLAGALDDMNPAGLRMLEVADIAEARRQGLLAFVDADYREAFRRLHASVCSGGSGVLEFPITGARGTRRWLETHAAPLRDENGAITGLLGVTRDITERKAAEAATRQLAFYDRLTGLPNRRLLEDRLLQAIARARREQQGMSLLFIDLDKFKPVNDEFGHATGDWLLQRVAERMLQCLRQSDTVARIGGDEFVVLLPDANVVADAVAVAEKIRLNLAVPFVTADGKNLAISSSIGVVAYPEHADNPRDLLRLGDEAMYRAKKAGRNAVEVFVTAAQPAAGQLMHRLHWKPAYACGEPTIDREHRELFRRANALLARAVGQDSDRAAFNEAFDALLRHVARHFAHEEEILRAHDFPGLREHAEEHRLLLERAGELRRQSEVAALPAGHLIEFLVADIVAGHMLGADTRFRGLFAAAKGPAGGRGKRRGGG